MNENSEFSLLELIQYTIEVFIKYIWVTFEATQIQNQGRSTLIRFKPFLSGLVWLISVNAKFPNLYILGTFLYR